MPSKRDIIAGVWKRILQRPFSLREFTGLLKQYGGYDMHNLSKRQLADLIQDRFDGDWNEPRFSFFELAYYWSGCLEVEGKLDPEQVVCWVGSILIVGEMVRRGHMVWGGHFDLWWTQFKALEGELDWELIVILGETFRPA